MQPLNFIKNYRKAAGLSRAELARLANIPKHTLDKWESGETLPTDARKLYRVAKVLNCRIANLINWKEFKKLENKKED